MSLLTRIATIADHATAHHYMTKFQASYLLSSQDAIQGYHWETSQATLYPIVMYHRSETSSEIECISTCIISDDYDHNATAVHKFIEVIMIS